MTNEQLEAKAEEVYRAFCNSPVHVYLPPRPPQWSELPQVLKDAWKAAVLKAREN
jgi:hypothetical protein